MRRRRRAGRLRPPPCGAPGRAPRPRGRRAARRPSPAKLSGVTLRIPMIQVRRPQSNVRGPTAIGRGRAGQTGSGVGRQRAGGCRGAATQIGARTDHAALLWKLPLAHRRIMPRSGRVRVAQRRVVHEPGPDGADEVQRTGHDDRPAAGPRGRDPVPRPGSEPCGRPRRGERPARPRPGPRRASPAAGPRRCTRSWRRPGTARPPRRPPPRPRPCRTWTPRPRSAGPEPSRRRRRGAAGGRPGPARGHGPRPGCGRRRGGPRASSPDPGTRAVTSSSRPGQRAAA